MSKCPEHSEDETEERSVKEGPPSQPNFLQFDYSENEWREVDYYEIRFMSKKNIIQGKSFMEMLDRTIKRYTNRSVEAAQVVEELIEIARKVREERSRGKQQNMSDDEIAFYDALGVNDSAVQVLGDETLRKIALELTQIIRNSVTIDWTQRESVRAEIRLKVKKILRKYGYPPDKREQATRTVLEQAEVIARDWSMVRELPYRVVERGPIYTEGDALIIPFQQMEEEVLYAVAFGESTYFLLKNKRGRIEQYEAIEGTLN